MSEEDVLKDQRFPGTQWHDIGDIEWNYYKHWGQGVWAGEGLQVQRHGDRSGCVEIINGCKYTSPPCVVLARSYRKKGETDVGISAVFSYPKGMGLISEYFWEIYPGRGDDIERFIGDMAEQEMEEAIKEILLSEERTSH